ncbi:MAG: response regulator [Butyrivibrio sp.]|nr:response regulator [Butyrivibrio sp.]
MKTDKKGNKILSIAISGTAIIAAILVLGTFMLGNKAGNDTKSVVRNVSLLYLSELAGRREQVVSAVLDNYIRDLDTALGLIEAGDLESFDNLRTYQLRMKQLYDLDKFAFIDANGLIYTSRGTRSDIDQYQIDYVTISEPEISIKNLDSREKKVIIAVPADNLMVEGKKLVVCFMEIDMSTMLQNVSLSSNNSTTFCNIYTESGVALTDMVLGGLASEDNLLDAMKNAAYEKNSSYEKFIDDFENGTSGVVSFTYNGINETLYYVPVRGTDWMLTYLIRESIIGEQIDTISQSIISRGLIQSILTALVLAGMFVLIFIQQRQSAKAKMEMEVNEAENRVKQQELEEQLAMQEELLEQEKKGVEQDNMIKALSSDYKGVYYVSLDTDDAICYKRDDSFTLPFETGQHFPFLATLTEYGNKYVAKGYAEKFFRFINPANIRMALAKEKVIFFRYLTIKDGNESYEMLSMAGVRLSDERDDHVIHAVGVGFSDIDAQIRESMSQQEALAQALKSAEEASRAKSGFVSNMSHEIRTPITAILGMNEMIMRESEDENILSYADNINTAGVSLLGIISNILDFSKIEAGKIELVEDAYSLQNLIIDLYNLIQLRAETKGISFVIQTDKSLPKGLYGDELRVKQVLANLLTNGVKYTEKGSLCLDIKCREIDYENKKVRIAVSVNDTGIGIKPEEMQKLFTPFDRLDISRTRNIEGTGLGLSISRELVHLMGSELVATSEYGKGSTFSFEIWQGISDPEAIGDFDPKAKKITQDTGKNKRSVFTAPGKRILVVDDTPMNLQVIQGLLKRTKMVVETASNGEECISMIGEKTYDLVFMDYRMPGMDGVETLKKLRKVHPEKTEGLPIIALTASAIQGDRERLIDDGFTDYLSKHVNIAEMEEMLKKYVGGKVEEEVEKNSDQDQDLDVLHRIREIPELDCEKGLEYCGDEDDYLFALGTYAESVPEKAQQLDDLLERECYDDYALLVHSIKSMSISIGACTLGERAKELEVAARAGDLKVLKDEAASFAEDYRALGKKIKNVCEK